MDKGLRPCVTDAPCAITSTIQRKAIRRAESRPGRRSRACPTTGSAPNAARRRLISSRWPSRFAAFQDRAPGFILTRLRAAWIFGAVWRDENEAVLTRLEDELLVDRIWVSDLGPARDDKVGAPPRRAAGMIPLLCDRPGGREARGAALNGDLAAMRALIAPVRLAGYSAPLLHHLALAHPCAPRPSAGRPRGVARSRMNTFEIAAWVALAEERRYLLELARAVVGSAARGERGRAHRAVDAGRRDRFALGEVARHGARDLALGAAAALGALGRVEEACAIAGAATATSKRMAAKAERARSGAIEGTRSLQGARRDRRGLGDGNAPSVGSGPVRPLYRGLALGSRR